MNSRKPPQNDQRNEPGSVSRSSGSTLRTFRIGALPILSEVIRRARLEEFLSEYLREDQRCIIPPSRGIILLVENYLTSREPIYGVGDWARQQSPEHLGLTTKQVSSINDDRVARCLDRMYEADHASLVLATLRHVVKEFRISLEELHNDSTTLTFSGEYNSAADRLKPFGRETRIVTWGHNKDHRPDLKQLLFTLTVTADGAVPVNFDIGDGNLTDDQTHRDTWDLVRELTGTPDFLYVADSKLATADNMAHIHSRNGRFVTVLPRTRREDKEFRKRLAKNEIKWSYLCTRYTSDGQHEDRVSIAEGDTLTREGYRLLWYRSSRKAQIDTHTRSKAILRTLQALGDLQAKLVSPRTRYTKQEKVAKAVEARLSKNRVQDWIRVEIKPRREDEFKQEGPGRPGKHTKFVKKTKERFELSFRVDHEAVDRSEKEDGVFPLVLNDTELSAEEVLRAYKRQASIEKRFSQLKTDYQLAPVFLKSSHRVEAMLCVYFLALLIQALVERELRREMAVRGIESLACYPEGRACKSPTSRKIIDMFERVERHELKSMRKQEPVRFAPELSNDQELVLELLDVSKLEYEN